MAIVRLGAVLVLMLAAPAAAQSARCVSCAIQADSVFTAGNAVATLEHAIEGLKQDSNDVEMLWRAARSEIAMGIVARERALSDAHYIRATAYARHAVALEPNNADMHFWLAASLGRRALRAGFRSALPLASETYTSASRALALDSSHAGAHEVMGKLHSEVRKLPWVVRRLAASLTKLDVARTASWESAERHLKRANALDPTLMLALVDLSQLYLRTGRRAEAIAIVEQLEKMPPRTPADAYLQGEARRRLDWY
jgi:tetratricopeptide (TPR) repeat protein